MYCNLVYYWLLHVSLKSMPFQVFDAVSSQLLSTETMNVLSSSEFLFVIWVRDFNFLIPRIPKYNDSFAKRYNIMAAIQIHFIKTILTKYQAYILHVILNLWGLSTKGTKAPLISVSFRIILSSSALESMAVHKTACGKVMKFGIQTKGRLKINHSKFGVSTQTL